MVKWSLVISEVLRGVLDGLIYILIYMYLLPLLLTMVSAGAPSTSYYMLSEVSSAYPQALVIEFVMLFEALSISSRLLKGNVLSPTLAAVASSLGLLVTLYIVNTTMPGGLLTVKVMEGQSVAVISISLRPLLEAFIVLIVLPLIVLPFVEYFLNING